MATETKIKGKLKAQGAVELSQQTAETVIVTNAQKELISSSVTKAELEALPQAVEDLQTLSGVAANAQDLGAFTGSLLSDDLTIKEAIQELETLIEGLPDPMEYKGVWDASTNTPTLTDGTGNNGDVYYVSVAGTQFTPSIAFKVGDKVVYNGALSKYEKWDVIDPVDTDEVPEGAANKYFTDERAQDAVGTILTDSDTVDFTYDDSTPSISASVKVQQSITSDASGIKLEGDSATPGNDKYYGTNQSGVKGFHDLPTGGEPNDIQETAFALANNQSTPVNITGFVVSNDVRSFKALVSVEVAATASLFEAFDIVGINKNGSWDISVIGAGDDSLISFSITALGQVQYTSGNYSGFVDGTLRFRAITTSF
jgi:hypothetical protein